MSNKAVVIKISKNVGSKIELVKNVINIFTKFNDIKLSETETTVLAYFIVYGVNTQTKNLIVKSNVCKNINNVKTVMVKLKKLEFIYKDDFSGKVLVNKALCFEPTPTLGMYLKLSIQN